MDPATAYLEKKAIDLALAKVEQLLREANEKERSQVERCTKFLEACMAAVNSLEQEYDGILGQTVTCADDPAALRQLRKRIVDYLHIDKLRAGLIDATTGLDAYRQPMEESANTMLQWPWKKADKVLAVRLFGKNLAELEGYLKKLNSEDLPNRPSATGIGQEGLFEILRHIDTSPAFRTSSLRELGERLQRERKKEPLVDHVRRIRVVIEEMRKAFG